MQKIKITLLYILKNIKYAWIQISVLNNEKYILNKLKGDIVRNTHSIEKGLSLEFIKNGFGFLKIHEASKKIDNFIAHGGRKDDPVIRMFFSALKSYLEYHKSINYNDNNILWVQNYYNSNSDLWSKTSAEGGILSAKKLSLSDNDRELIQRLFFTRHSAREFDGTPVNEDNLKKAIEMAMHCPSACNRQCYRLYIVNKNSFEKLNGWLDGSGGFADELDKVLVVTGCMSVYKPEEENQWLITGSIFASYLSLSLHCWDIGSCFMQRLVVPNKRGFAIMKKLGIPQDEQIVCCLGIGNLKEVYKAPISYRFPYDDLVKKV